MTDTKINVGDTQMEIERGNSDRLIVDCFRKQITIEIESDWHGDTETGFGASLTFGLTFDEADQLRDFLTKLLTKRGQL